MSLLLFPFLVPATMVVKTERNVDDGVDLSFDSTPGMNICRKVVLQAVSKFPTVVIHCTCTVRNYDSGVI